jgi:hypothetical protein
MPSRWHVRLAGPAGADIPLTAPLAVISSWLDDPPARQPPRPGHARPARSGHDDQARKWAFGPIETLPGQAGAGIVLEVRLLDDHLAPRLRRATAAGQPVRLGTGHFTITGPATLIDQASWPELRRWTGTRAWQVRFLTPACFRRGNRTSPWPAPETLARGLADRWRRLHPDTAPPPLPSGAFPIWVSDIDGHSEVQNLTRNIRRNSSPHQEDEIISGFTGRIRYVCDQGTSEEAATFDALIALATYAGAGSHTTHGFGTLRPEPTWQPPTTRTKPPATRPQAR